MSGTSGHGSAAKAADRISYPCRWMNVFGPRQSGGADLPVIALKYALINAYFK